MAATVSGSAALLDALEASVNSILLNVASAFNDNSGDDSERLAQTKHRIHCDLPDAYDNFHMALDGLESEITRAKAVLTRDLLLMQAANKAPGSPPKPIGESAPDISDAPAVESKPELPSNEPSQLDNTGFELIEKPDTTEMSTDQAIKPEQAPSDSTEQPKDNSATSKEASKPDTKPEGKPTDSDDAQKKGTAAAGDEPSNSALGTQGEPESKTEGDGKPSPNEINDDNGFNELLPGLSMYANDPSNDPPPLLEMDTLNDQSLSNAFGDGGENAMEDFEAGLFGDGDMIDGTNTFADMISFDEATGQNEDGEAGGMDVFDDAFFNLSGDA